MPSDLASSINDSSLFFTETSSPSTSDGFISLFDRENTKRKETVAFILFAKLRAWIPAQKLVLTGSIATKIFSMAASLQITVKQGLCHTIFNVFSIG